MTERTDLTANRAFRDNKPNNEFDNVIMVDYKNENMSLDEYNEIVRQERLWGKRMHTNSFKILFPKERESLTECLRCGKRLIPWRDTYYICKKCGNKLEEKTLFKKNVMKSVNKDDIFGLR